MKNITVLSTACGAIFMPGFFKCLKNNNERNIRIVGVDCEENPAMQYIVDAFYCVPRYNSNDYVDNLLVICKKEKVDIFFPQISMELPIIAENIEKFEKIGVRVAMSNPRTLKVANSKFKLYEIMKDANIYTPQYYLIRTVDDLIKYSYLLGYPKEPVCVKVTESSGSRGVRIIKKEFSKSKIFLQQKPSSLYVTMEDMCDILSEMQEFPEMIVMKYLPGCEYTVDLLADHGEILYMAGRRNTVSSASIAMESVVEKKEQAYNICEKVVKLLALDGNIGFDFMLDENDEPVLTDLNPRITATIVLFLAAGINFPYLRVKQLLGEKLPDIEIKYGAQLVRKYEDIIISDVEE